METTIALTNSTSTETRTCDFCHAEEGQLRIVGQFEVQLKPVMDEGKEKLACQSCAQKVVRYKQLHTEVLQDEDKRFFHLKKLVNLFVHACVIIAIFSIIGYAQPPGLPTNPTEAPIDGGLGLLAAAGGAYAIKKLKNKRDAEMED